MKILYPCCRNVLILKKLFHLRETFSSLRNLCTLNDFFHDQETVSSMIKFYIFNEFLNFLHFSGTSRHKSSDWCTFCSCSVYSYRFTRFRNFQVNLSRSTLYCGYFKFLLSYFANICFF